MIQDEGSSTNTTVPLAVSSQGIYLQATECSSLLLEFASKHPILNGQQVMKLLRYTQAPYAQYVPATLHMTMIHML